MDTELLTKHAALAVETMASVRGVDLDYSPASLKHIDEALLSMRSEGLCPEDLPGVLYTFGCYLGEIIVRHANGLWVASPPEFQEGGFAPFSVVTPDGVSWNPLAKCHKVLVNGVQDSVYDLFLAASGHAR